MPLPDRAWEDTERNMLYSMVTGDVDVEGRAHMIAAAGSSDLARMGELKNGFDDTQRDHQVVLAEFHACCTENEKRVFNIARKIIGAPPIP